MTDGARCGVRYAGVCLGQESLLEAGDGSGDGWARGLGPLVGPLLMRSPCAAVLRCAELLLAKAAPPEPRHSHVTGQLQRRQPGPSSGGVPQDGEEEEEGGAVVCVLDCLVAALAVSSEGLHARHLMAEQWAGQPGLGGGVGGARLRLKQGEVDWYPPAVEEEGIG